MNEEQIYTSSDGTQTPVSKLNNSHLVNALLKVSGILALNPNGFGDTGVADYEKQKALQQALKAEVLKRMPATQSK